MKTSLDHLPEWRNLIVEMSEARGRQEGIRGLITQLLETKFGALPADVLAKLQHKYIRECSLLPALLPPR